ncbi:hypothetical protein SAMN05216299_1338 [Nitrosospira sp. Nsp14]|uniref:hypothetical protein n=1 Tax=Nitrosospira sp. Nsp14 TaxID=1855333 RepID=UPI0008E76216|nr:hypothetical protein [Nitrosospira sp. Nsp14]SFH60692.1 hypothetical protein SAMN05216299_1338 [Nitrosospira sp. Nsp14]
MNILRRVEMLEAAVGRTNEGDCYKVVILKEGESYEEGIGREGLTDWPFDRILAICFESAEDS